MAVRFQQDHVLVREALEDKPQAWENLVLRIKDTVWTACILLSGDGEEGRVAFIEALDAIRADGFRRLRPYDGSSRIDTFIALVVREILADRIMRLIALGDEEVGWTAFERFFAADIERLISRRLSGTDKEEARRDAYQDICLALVADGFHRLKAYRGVGSFTGFVLQTVDNLLIDVIRRTVPRQRGAEPVIRPVMVPLSDEEDLHSADASPEEALLADENERLLAQATDALRSVAQAFTEMERLYLRIALGGTVPLPAREVARLMRRPVEEVYKLKQRVMSRLRGSLEKNPAVKLWRESV